MLAHLKKTDPEIYQTVIKELKRQQENLELIASENFTPLAVLEAQGSVLTNKYAEGYPRHRWYGGCDLVDRAEDLARERAKELFSAEHANVQAHSGTQANMAVFFCCLNLGDPVLAMDLACGGHLSHGHPLNYSGKYFKIIPYGLNHKTEQLDYDEILTLAKKHKPKLILAGASAYPRSMDFAKFRAIADSVGAILMVDMAHIAGLVAAGLHPNPVPYAEFVTSTTHKTLRGPRGGFVLCQQEFAKKLDTEIFPGIQGGPLMHVIAAKAVAFKEAMTPKFKAYQKQIVKNSRALAAGLKKKGFRIISGGTDTHLMLVDLTPKGITGKDAAQALDLAGITVNKNLIPFDLRSAAITSGIRLGTPAVTTRGMKVKEMQKIAAWIDQVVEHPEDEVLLAQIKKQVLALTKKFPLYPEL
jgi:glycine hydroxymethyltransferase